MGEPVRCAGAVVFDGAGRLLLVRRGNEPSRGLWCEPAGRCEPGESAAQACVRETREETGVDVRVLRTLGSVVIGEYLIEGFECAVVGGEPVAGDDADDLRWVTRAEFAALPLAPGLAAALEAWDCLPR